MTEPNCKYYLMHKESDKHVFPLDGKPYCDLLDCKSQEGLPFRFEGDGNLVAKCSTNYIIENGDPVDEKGKLISFGRLEEEVGEENLDEVDFNAYKGVKPMDLKTGNENPYPN